MAITAKENSIRTFYGLSTDTKPASAPQGSTFYERDTKDTYRFMGGQWEQITTLNDLNLNFDTLELDVEQLDVNTDELEAKVDLTTTAVGDADTHIVAAVNAAEDDIEATNVLLGSGSTVIGELQDIEADVEAGNALLTTIDADTSNLAGRPYTVLQAPAETTNNGAIGAASTLNPGFAWELVGFELHVTAGPGGSGTLAVAKDAASGAAYDVSLLSRDMTAESDVVFYPDVPIKFGASDQLTFSWENAGGKTWGLTVWYARRY